MILLRWAGLYGKRGIKMRKQEAIQVLCLIMVLVTAVVGLLIIDYQNELYKKYGSSTLTQKVTESERKRFQSMNSEEKQKIYNELRKSQSK